jgi:hypothetical protein
VNARHLSKTRGWKKSFFATRRLLINTEMSTSYNQLRQSQGSKLSNLNSSTGSNEKIGSEIVVPSLAANGNRKSVGSMNLKSSQSDKMNSTMVKHSTSDLLQAYTDGDLKHESSGQLESSKTIEAANNNNNQEKKKSLQELDSILGDFSKSKYALNGYKW